MNPLEKTVSWLTRQVGFPARRLERGAELLLCVGALAEAQEAAERGRFLVERKDGAQEAALRMHALRRSRVHYKCDNSAKV
jgi:hypothetical protein